MHTGVFPLEIDASANFLRACAAKIDFAVGSFTETLI